MELADRAAAATLAGLPVRRSQSDGPRRGTRTRRPEGPYTTLERSSQDACDAQPPMTPTQIMREKHQPPSSQAFLLDPDASLGPATSGEMWIQAAMQGPTGDPHVLDPPGAATVAAAPAPPDPLEGRFDAMENRFLQALTPGFGTIKKEQDRRQAQMSQLTGMLVAETSERRQQVPDLQVRFEELRLRPRAAPVHFYMAQHDASSSKAAAPATPPPGGWGRGRSEETTPEKHSRRQQSEDQKRRQRQWEAVEKSDGAWAATLRQKRADSRTETAGPEAEPPRSRTRTSEATATHVDDDHGTTNKPEEDRDLPAVDIPLPKFAAPQSGAGGVPLRLGEEASGKSTTTNRWMARADAGARATPGGDAGEGLTSSMRNGSASSPSPQLPPGVQLHCREAPCVRGDGVLVFRQDPIYRTVTVGYFQERTRTTQATSEVMSLMKLIGMDEEIQEVLPAPPSCQVVRTLMLNRLAAGDRIKKLKGLRASTENSAGILWANKGQTQEDQARSGPLRRAGRLLQDERERRQQGGAEEAAHLPEWTPEAFYALGREAVYIRWEARNLEEKLLYRGKTGAWEGNDLSCTTTSEGYGRAWSALGAASVFRESPLKSVATGPRPGDEKTSANINQMFSLSKSNG